MRRYQLIPSHAVQTLLITTTSPLPSGEVGFPYSFTFNAIGGVPPYTWLAGTLPSGLSMSSSGTISGTPTTPIVTSFNVLVIDSINSQFSKSFGMTVVRAVTIHTTSPLPNATQGIAYGTTMSATGGATPYTWALLGQTGSNAWSVSSAGVVTGTPSVLETDILNIQVVDALGVPSAANFNLQVVSGGVGSFDFFISPTGNNANNGTSISTPWAITALNVHTSLYPGKRVGIMPGTYDVSGLMGTFHSPALQINGGPDSSHKTYIASCDASGNYSPRTATLDAKGASGLFGGGNANISTIMGSAQGFSPGPATPVNWGNWTVDGLRFIGWSIWAVQVGSYDSSGGAVPNATFQFCEITGGDGSHCTVGVSGLHSGAVELYQYITACTLLGNWIHDNVTAPGVDFQHYSAITVWGGILGTSTSSGLLLQQNTIVNSGGIYGIPDTGIIGGSTIVNNYIDCTNAAAGTGNPGTVAILGFANSAAASHGLGPSKCTNNIFRGGAPCDTFASEGAAVWSTAFQWSNNTWDLAGGAGLPAGGALVGHRFF